MKHPTEKNLKAKSEEIAKFIAKRERIEKCLAQHI